jgi:hypothetical protein
VTSCGLSSAIRSTKAANQLAFGALANMRSSDRVNYPFVSVKMSNYGADANYGMVDVPWKIVSQICANALVALTQ